MDRKVLYTEDLKYCTKILEVDEDNAYMVFKYKKSTMDIIIRLHEVYCENSGSFEIESNEQKDLVIDIAKQYTNFISIEESPSVFGDVYYKVHSLKKYGILDDNHTEEICEAFLSPALENDKEVIALKWDICNSEWYFMNIQSYIKSEYRADFVRMLSFYKLLCPHLSTKECFAALYDILLSLKNEKQKHTYIFKDTTGYYMIGHTKNIPQRYGNVRVGNTTLEMVCHLNGDYANHIHKTFAHKKIEGIWFDLTQDDLNKIKNFQNK